MLAQFFDRIRAFLSLSVCSLVSTFEGRKVKDLWTRKGLGPYSTLLSLSKM